MHILAITHAAGMSQHHNAGSIHCFSSLNVQVMLLVMSSMHKFCNKDAKYDITPVSGSDNAATLIDMKKNEVYGVNMQQTSEQQPHTAVYEEVPSQ